MCVPVRLPGMGSAQRGTDRKSLQYTIVCSFCVIWVLVMIVSFSTSQFSLFFENAASLLECTSCGLFNSNAYFEFNDCYCARDAVYVFFLCALRDSAAFGGCALRVQHVRLLEERALLCQRVHERRLCHRVPVLAAA